MAMTASQITEAVRLYKAGWTPHEIAALFGMWPGAVRGYLLGACQMRAHASQVSRMRWRSMWGDAPMPPGDLTKWRPLSSADPKIKEWRS